MEVDQAFAIDLSEKNPLVELSHDASVVSLLGVFSSGAHRGLRLVLHHSTRFLNHIDLSAHQIFIFRSQLPRDRL